MGECRVGTWNRRKKLRPALRLVDFTWLILLSGAVPRAVRQRLHHVRVHPQLLRLLRGTGGQQRGRRVSPAVERDHRRLRRDPGGGEVQVHREDQVHWSDLHGGIW